jgi:hypothetical protein
MISRYIIPLLFIFSLSCNGQSTSSESEEIINAKWYYYSYAMELKAYDKTGEELQPLACDIKLTRVSKISSDTTKLFFVASSGDTLNTCAFKPLDLVGIAIVRNRLYLPIYHIVAFDIEDDSSVLARMNTQSLLLQNKVSENNRTINQWLSTEAKRRKINK